jgi:hypothetical protein
VRGVGPAADDHHRGPPDGSTTTTHSTERARVLPAERIKRGVDPQANELRGIPPDPDIVLCLQGTEHFPLTVTPYWRAAPWPQLLTDYLLHSVVDDPPGWLAADVEHPTTDDVLPGLPVPDLNEWAEYSYTELAGVSFTRNSPVWPWNSTWANHWLLGKTAWGSGYRRRPGS